MNEAVIHEWEKLGWRGLYRNILMYLANRDKRVIAETADLTRVLEEKREMPEAMGKQYINCGIAEQNAVSVAAGLASCGYVVFFSTFASFASMRDLEQIRSDCAYMHYPVRIVGTDSGVALSTLGNTHYGLEDIGVMRAVPELTVVCPSDGTEMLALMEEMLDYPATVYIRIAGEQKVERIYTHGHNFKIGRAEVLKKGRDVTLVSCGNMMHNTITAAEKLAKDGIDAGIVDMHTIKPIDKDAVIEAAEDSGRIITVEEHVVNSGLGGAVSEVMAEAGKGKLLKIGIPDAFLKTVSPYDKFMEELGLTASAIYEKAKAFVTENG